MDFLSWAASAWQGLTGSAQVFVKAWAEVTDPSTWRSLGWLYLGFVMFVLGVLLWLRVPQAIGRTAVRVGTEAARAAV